MEFFKHPEEAPHPKENEGSPEPKEKREQEKSKEQLAQDILAVIEWMRDRENWEWDEVEIGEGDWNYEPTEPDFETAKNIIRAMILGDDKDALNLWQKISDETAKASSSAAKPGGPLKA